MAMEQKLAAIVAARGGRLRRLLGEDEAATLAARCRSHHHALIDPTIACIAAGSSRSRSSARWSSSRSARAIECALEIQRGMARAPGRRPDQACLLRIGVDFAT